MTLYAIGQIVDYVDLVQWQREPPKPVISANAKWFCVTCNPNCQSRAALGLHAAGFRTFLPKIRKWVCHARVRKAVEKPLLGRYLFVEVDHGRQNFGAVRAVNGVEGIVSNPDPVAIPSHFIDDFRLRYMAGEFDEISKSPYPIGARVRIVEGQFENMLATITARKGQRLDFKLFEKNQYGRMQACSVRAA